MKVCPNCGSKIIERKIGSSLVIKCTKCDYSVATSNVDLIFEDDTNYSIILEEGNAVNLKVISIIKKLTKLSTSEAVDIIKNNCPYIICKGNAVLVKEIKTELDTTGISYSISPSFEWK